MRIAFAARGTTVIFLAELYRTQGDCAKAESLYQRSLAIGQKALGRDHFPEPR